MGNVEGETLKYVYCKPAQSVAGCGLRGVPTLHVCPSELRFGVPAGTYPVCSHGHWDVHVELLG